jgi:hypothetical protein
VPDQNRLTPEQSALANELLESVRSRLKELSAGNPKVLHHMRRRIMKRLEFDERDTPAARRKLKDYKWKEQRGV